MTEQNITPAKDIIYVMPDGREIQIIELSENPELFLENYNLLSINARTQQTKEQIKLAQKYEDSINHQEPQVLDFGNKDNKIFLTEKGTELIINLYLEEQRIRNMEITKGTLSNFVIKDTINKSDLNVTKFIGDIIVQTNFDYDKASEFLNKFYEESDKIRKDSFIENIIYENSSDSYTIKLNKEGEKWLITELQATYGLKSKIYAKNEKIIKQQQAQHHPHMEKKEIQKEQEYLNNLEKSEPDIEDIKIIEKYYENSIKSKNSYETFDEIQLERIIRSNEIIDEYLKESETFFDDKFLEDAERIIVPKKQTKYHFSF